MCKKPMVVLTGPTAVGKSDLSISLCKAINGAVISADSMQVYKYMDIGSAKIMPSEMQGIDHYLIDVLDPSDEFHVARFKAMAMEALDKIYEKNQIPVIVGGTGFYIQSVLYDIAFEDQEEESDYRKELEAYANTYGNHLLHEKLKEIDPISYQSIHENNRKRVIRALEFYKQSGKPISLHNEAEKAKLSPYNFAYFVLNDKRENLYSRIDQRVDKMLENGLLDEVKRLEEKGYTRDMVSMQGLGYKEILDYFSGKLSLEEAIYTIKRDSRHFAKRQLTWFRREKEVIWLNKDEYNYDDHRLLFDMIEILKEKEILC